MLTPSTGLARALHASLSFSEHEIVLEELGTEFSGGTVAMHGSAAIAGRGLERYELNIDAQDVSLEPMEGVQLTLAGETTLVGGARARLPSLSGVLRVQRAVYTRPFSLGIAERLTGFSQAKRAEREVYDPARDRLALDLRVVDDAPCAQQQPAHAALVIEDSEQPFRVVGTDQRVGLLARSRSGAAPALSQHEFRVEDGTVRFVDEHRVRPLIDVRARTSFAALRMVGRALVDPPLGAR